MKSWVEFLVDATPIRAIYGQELPTLESVDLHEIVLHRDGPRVLLRFDLFDFPRKVPEKWAALRFNRVQLKLMAFGVRDLAIAGLGMNNRVDLNLVEEGLAVRLTAENGVIRFDLVAESLFVENVSAYLDNSRLASAGS